MKLQSLSLGHKTRKQWGWLNKRHTFTNSWQILKRLRYECWVFYTHKYVLKLVYRYFKFLRGTILQENRKYEKIFINWNCNKRNTRCNIWDKILTLVKTIKYLQHVNSTFLDSECLGRVWNLTVAFTFNAERHFLFLNQMQRYAYEAALRKGRTVIRKLIRDGEADFPLVKRAWEDKCRISQPGF